MAGNNVLATHYVGRCRTCGKVISAELKTSREETKTPNGVIPPPIIAVSCSCQIPVVYVELVYQT